MDDLQKDVDNQRDEVDADIDPGLPVTDEDEATDLIHEAKEMARRDWNAAYDDVDPQGKDIHEDFEGDVLQENPDFEASGVGASTLVSGFHTDNAAHDDVMADDLRARAENLGDQAPLAGTELGEQPRDARVETGRADDDVRQDSHTADVNPNDSDRTVVDGIQDTAKGIVDRIKGVFGGDDKKS